MGFYPSYTIQSLSAESLPLAQVIGSRAQTGMGCLGHTSVVGRMKKTLFRIFTFALLLCAAKASQADSATEHELKAAYLYHIINFVHWPDDRPRKQGEKIEVCFIADDDFEQILKSIEKKPVQNRNIHVRRISDRTLLSICNMLFIHEVQITNLQDLLAEAKKHDILTIGDLPQFAQKGGMIGFVVYQDRIRLEVNLGAIQNTELEVSAKLLEIALHVIGQNGEHQ